MTTGEDIGLAYIKINPALLDSVVDNIQDTIPVAVQIYNPLGKVFTTEGISTLKITASGLCEILLTAIKSGLGFRPLTRFEQPCLVLPG